MEDKERSLFSYQLITEGGHYVMPPSICQKCGAL